WGAGYAPGAAHSPVGEPAVSAAAAMGDRLCRAGLARARRGAPRRAARHAAGVLRRAPSADQGLPSHRTHQQGRELLPADVPGRLPRGPVPRESGGLERQDPRGAGAQGSRAHGGVAPQPPRNPRGDAALPGPLHGMARRTGAQRAQMSGSPFGLAGRVAVVTGGYGVIGGAIASGLARAGAAVAILGRRRDAAEAKAQAIRDGGGDALAL